MKDKISDGRLCKSHRGFTVSLLCQWMYRKYAEEIYIKLRWRHFQIQFFVMESRRLWNDLTRNKCDSPGALTGSWKRNSRDEMRVNFRFAKLLLFICHFFLYGNVISRWTNQLRIFEDYNNSICLMNCCPGTDFCINVLHIITIIIVIVSCFLFFSCFVRLYLHPSQVEWWWTCKSFFSPRAVEIAQVIYLLLNYYAILLLPLSFRLLCSLFIQVSNNYIDARPSVFLFRWSLQWNEL